MPYTLTIYHLFPDYLNLYGDRGNILSLQKRCEWRGIKVKFKEVNKTDDLDLSQTDILFIGGGSDREQFLVTKELMKIKEDLKFCMEDGMSILSICGGYQFLGDYYKKLDGTIIKGLELLDFYTEAKPKRLVGNIHATSEQFGNIIGFENHGGYTYHSYQPLGTVVSGFGNNDHDKTEGLLYKNTIGTYLHGPILPKNPAITDWLISSAMERKYGMKKLSPLNDTLEINSKQSVLELYS